MSDKEIDVFISKNECSEIVPLLDGLKSRDWFSIIKLLGERTSMLVGAISDFNDADEINNKFNHYFDPDLDFTLSDEFLHFTFTTANSFDEEEFQYLLQSLGATKVEMMLHESGAGEYTFLLNDEYFDEFSDNEWNWLTEPLDVFEKHVVFTGKLDTCSREEIEELADEYGAIVQKTVNGKTDFLVIGKNVGEKKLTKASELGISIITENEFLKSIGENC